MLRSYPWQPMTRPEPEVRPKRVRVPRPQSPVQPPPHGPGERYAPVLALVIGIFMFAVVGISVLVAYFAVDLVAGWFIDAAGPTLMTGLMGAFLTLVCIGPLVLLAVHPERWHMFSSI